VPTAAAPIPPSDPSAARDLASALSPAEHVLWAGRPDERHYVRADPRLIVLGIFWVLVAGAGFWGFTITLLSAEYDGISHAARVVLLLLAAAPFIAVAVVCLGGHVVLKRRLRLRHAYAITTRRVLARRPAMGVGGKPVLRELAFESLGDVRVETARRETGTIDFHSRSSAESTIQFETVRGAAAIAGLARERASQRTPST
jgi:hypothetical protein